MKDRMKLTPFRVFAAFAFVLMYSFITRAALWQERREHRQEVAELHRALDAWNGAVAEQIRRLDAEKAELVATIDESRANKEAATALHEMMVRHESYEAAEANRVKALIERSREAEKRDAEASNLASLKAEEAILKATVESLKQDEERLFEVLRQKVMSDPEVAERLRAAVANGDFPEVLSSPPFKERFQKLLDEAPRLSRTATPAR